MLQQTRKIDSSEAIKSQLQSDMNHFFSRFKEYSLGQKTLARRAELNLKTIQRLSRCENLPGHITLMKVYKVLLGEENPQKLLALLPQVIRESVIQDKGNILSSGLDYSLEIKREVLHDQVFCEIYFLIDAGSVTKKLIQFKFGEHGLHILDKMHSLNAIRYVDNEKIELGSVRLELDAGIIKNVGLNLSEKYTKPENCEIKGENFLGFYVESLPEDAYQEWLRLDHEVFLKKIEIAKKYKDIKKGKKVFTYVSTDTFAKGNHEVNYN